MADSPPRLITMPLPLEDGLMGEIRLPVDGLSARDAERIAGMVRTAFVVRDTPRQRSPKREWWWEGC